MNARSHALELDLEERQVEEAVLALFHTILFHRSTGKYHYVNDTLAIGTVGFTDVECDFIDFNYVRVNSETLDICLRRDVRNFWQAIKSPNTPSPGQISLEFFQRKKGRWSFSSDTTAWEVWNLKINIVNLNSENERKQWRVKVGEKLGENLLQITQSINQADFLPLPHNEAELDIFYDTSFPDVQPYLFKVVYEVSSPTSNPSVSTAVKKLIKNTLSLT